MSKTNTSMYEEKENEGFKMPTPFKKCLILPKTPVNKNITKRKRTNFPAVVSSKIYREFYKKKETNTLKQKAKKPVIPDDDSSSESVDMDMELDNADLDISDPKIIDLANRDYVIVKYSGNYYPGLILRKDVNGAEIKAMKKAEVGWQWAEKEDTLYYLYEDIVCPNTEPILRNNRGLKYINI